MQSLADAPRLTTAIAEELAGTVYGVSGRATVLPSERDQNFLIETGSARYVLKIANAREDREHLAAAIAAIRHLAATGLAPRLVTTRSGDDLEYRHGHFVRLITWIDGRPLGATPRH